MAGSTTATYDSAISFRALECRRQSGSFATVSIQLPELGTSKRHGTAIAAVFELAEVTERGSQVPRFGELLIRRPVAATALLPKSVVLFTAGAVAGALGKTLTAPLDRVKLLLQTRGGLQAGALKEAARGGGVIGALAAIGKEEGFLGYWKGNIPQILKVIPYSAIQLCTYEAAKRGLRDREGNLSIPARLTAGAVAGMTATLMAYPLGALRPWPAVDVSPGMTYPLDTLRLRLAVDPASRSISGAARALMREGSHGAFFRGLGASMIGIAPYMALELGVFDLMPRDLPPFARGFSSALMATTLCYPLDTVRRQIQLQSTARLGALPMARTIMAREGVPGFYRGFLPNALKNLPNKGVRLAVFDGAKKLLIRAEEAYREEVETASSSAQGLRQCCK